MGEVIEFKCKQQKEIEERLAEFRVISKLIREEKSKKKANWVFQTRDGFIKVIEGNELPPPVYSLGKKPIYTSYLRSDTAECDFVKHEKYDFKLIDQLTDGSFLFMEL